MSVGSIVGRFEFYLVIACVMTGIAVCGPGVRETEEVVIRDKSGSRRIVLGMDGNVPSIRMFDEKGTRTLSIESLDMNGARVLLYGAGPDSSTPRLTFESGKTGAAIVLAGSEPGAIWATTLSKEGPSSVYSNGNGSRVSISATEKKTGVMVRTENGATALTIPHARAQPRNR